MGKTPSLSLTHTPTITIFKCLARTLILFHHCTCLCRRKTHSYTSRAGSKRMGSEGSSPKTCFCCYG